MIDQRALQTRSQQTTIRADIRNSIKRCFATFDAPHCREALFRAIADLPARIQRRTTRRDSDTAGSEQYARDNPATRRRCWIARQAVQESLHRREAITRTR